MKKAKYIVAFFMPVSVFILASLSFNATVGFSLASLKDYEFWRSYILMLAITMSSYFSAQYIRHGCNVGAKEYMDNEAHIFEVVKGFGAWLSDYLHIYNRNKKKEVYKQEILAKIEKLQRKKDKLAERGRRDEQTLSVLAYFDAKIAALRAKIDKDTMEREIDFTAVKYRPVRRQQIVGADWKNGKTEFAELEDPEKFYAIHGAKRLVISLVLTAIMTCIVADAVITADRSVILYLLTNTFSVCTAVMSGIKIADDAFAKILLPNQNERIGILNGMRKWVESQGATQEKEANH